MIEELLPAAVATAATTGEHPVASLFPEERAAVAGAVEKRRQEFATARFCARQALARLGVAPVALPPGPRRAPQWPPGIVGSITHCSGYRAAAVARAAEVWSLGIDAEPDKPLPEGVLETIALPEERHMLERLTACAPAAVSWDRLLFSAKESVYKAWFPLAGRWLGFEEAHITIVPRPDAPGSGGFQARLLVPGPQVNGVSIAGFTGRWLARDGLVLTAIAVLPED